MKTLVQILMLNGIIRVHTLKITEQETAKSARAEVLKKKLNLKSGRPNLQKYLEYYISPDTKP